MQKNRGTDQLLGNRAADQHHCFHFKLSTTPLLPNFKPLAIFCGCTAWFVSDLVRKPMTGFLMMWLKWHVLSVNNRQKHNKLTRNKNARHIFPRHFLTVAMIGIKCLYMHFVLYIFHTRSLFFKYLHYTRSYNNHCTKCTCTS